jgi:hypothetical protein
MSTGVMAVVGFAWAGATCAVPSLDGFRRGGKGGGGGDGGFGGVGGVGIEAATEAVTVDALPLLVSAPASRAIVNMPPLLLGRAWLVRAEEHQEIARVLWGF